ncbi:hypothetical protein [Nitrospira sp. KM1]|uniref:hypothetical protein n=1 Tax=Nitrospira sp. KM1 TaxID=1936990 RepID=UPI001567C4F8|nr:hypothetical protein [Nitrospira sp. KM1]
MAVIPVKLFDAFDRCDDAFERVARKVEVECMLKRRIAFVRREDLNVAPRETQQIRAFCQATNPQIAQFSSFNARLGFSIQDPALYLIAT